MPWRARRGAAGARPAWRAWQGVPSGAGPAGRARRGGGAAGHSRVARPGWRGRGGVAGHSRGGAAGVAWPGRASPALRTPRSAPRSPRSAPRTPRSALERARSALRLPKPTLRSTRSALAWMGRSHRHQEQPQALTKPPSTAPPSFRRHQHHPHVSLEALMQLLLEAGELCCRFPAVRLPRFQCERNRAATLRFPTSGTALTGANADLGELDADLGSRSADLDDATADLDDATADLAAPNAELARLSADLGDAAAAPHARRATGSLGRPWLPGLPRSDRSCSASPPPHAALP
ncbi:hypothetical protein SAMN05421630_1117 [Prauserella marina]|uniref:Uncharacterized protein n=1 Tax=Prauserella marina TaxID=530584 RepID=A0A1G6WLD8_9PSEU|nr:hypothetical protein DES30_109266 [Prauserella marina]SDD66599.1 hypothetical protein SAMN05421630_1117 [Prauserella marina]